MSCSRSRWAWCPVAASGSGTRAWWSRSRTNGWPGRWRPWSPSSARRWRRGRAAGAAGTDEPAPEIRLTADQLTAVDAIRSDLASGRPMMRLVQGDVGSGKTAVAALAIAFVADAGGQSALLAPTDLLARQHAAT